MEMETNGKLFFLDVMVTRRYDGTLEHQVYLQQPRKPANQDSSILTNRCYDFRFSTKTPTCNRDSESPVSFVFLFDVPYMVNKYTLFFTAPEVAIENTVSQQYSVQTLVMAVVAGAVSALVVGFIAGYLCGRKCHKDEDDNLPYPDTEYEYFEQRQNINR